MRKPIRALREFLRLLCGTGLPHRRENRLMGFVTTEDLERERAAMASLRFP